MQHRNRISVEVSKIILSYVTSNKVYAHNMEYWERKNYAKSHYCITLENDKVIGRTWIGVEDEKTRQVYIYIHPEHQGKGLYKNLEKYIVEKLLSKKK